ncbi:TonB-dependent receptor [Janthinobacterium sp. SUN026]|uniref:TonB-dependent receptor n=1 Tax=Janthinobacterium sp. SUN026 TaxID=3002438 RepID=UPI0025B1C60A|nr:TonB-dependent receptor [Janthinobacterium sp. SUN026]MDN2673869.1 TonB-dependent receptor [Janthinobacterium sp. SUN026]
MINHKRLRLTQIAFSLSIALAAAPSFAQNTTSSIGGRISATDGKPAAGATVTIVHTESGSVSNVTTDAEGRYVARGLRAGGPYTITITKNGEVEKREGVFVQLAETANVDATLGAQMQTVNVTGTGARAQIFNRSNMGAGTNIGPTELATQASISRSLQDYARADPRLSQTDKERGEISVAGQNSRYNSMTIDGVAVNDTFGLEASGTATGKQPISVEAIQSVQVNVANYDVTQKGYTGANINAVTKSGTNKVKGSVYYVFRNDKMSGERYNDTTGEYYDAPKSKDTTKGITLGGPLIEDKLFLFANYEKSSSSRSSPTFGPIGSPLTNVLIPQAAIDSAIAIAKDKYGIPIGTSEVPGGTEFTATEKLLKLDWNLTDTQRVMLRYSKTEQAEPMFPGFTKTGLSLSSYWYAQEKSLETIVAQWTSEWTPTFSTEVKLSNRKYDSVPKNNAYLPSIGLQFSGPGPDGKAADSRYLNFGTETSRQKNVLNNKALDAYLGANWALGDHDVKFGTDFSKTEVYNAFLQNVNGNYTFGCITTDALDCIKATTAQWQAAMLENFRNGRPSSYTLQAPVAGGSLDDAIARFTLKNIGLFVQDSWNVNKQLTLMAGLRVDGTRIGEKPIRNAIAAMPVGPVVAGRQTGGFGIDNTHTIDGENLYQPRFGFNYKLDSARPTQIRGGMGLFQGAAMAVWLGNPFQNTGVALRNFNCSSTGKACPTNDGFFSIDPLRQPTNVGDTVPAMKVDVLSPDLAQPSVWKANLAFEHELPWMGLVFGAEYLRTRTKDAIYYQELNLGAPTKTGSDGRALYWGANAYKVDCWDTVKGILNGKTGCRADTKAGNNAAFGQVLMATKTDKGEGNVLTLSLRSPMRNGLSWGTSYTYTDATEVSPLGSSTSSSNWGGRASFNPNENVASNSNYMVKDRFTANVSWQKRFFGEYKTSFGLFYEGRSGKPYSWTFNNDLNGDGLAGNDLMYIPKAPGSGEVAFYGKTPAESAANEAAFWAVVNSNGDLRKSAGKVMNRNKSFAPWTNSIDMRFSQEVPGIFKGNKGIITFDMLNVGNMINRKWGRINEIAFQPQGGQVRSFVDFVGIDAQGRYIYNTRPTVEGTETRQAKGESQWAIQATVKYEF